jgi:hypothetical protein
MKGVHVNPWLQTGLSLVAGLLTAGGALIGVRLSVRGHNRTKWWWRQFTWAADLALDNSPVKRVAGLKALTTLAQPDLAQRDTYLLLDVFPERVLDEVLRDLPALTYGTGGRNGGSRLTDEQIAAVRLRLLLDEQLGRQTPEVLQHIAALAGIGTVEHTRTDPPASQPETATDEVTDHHPRACFTLTAQQPNPDKAITPGRDRVAATPLDHSALSNLGSALPTRFGRTTQQTNPDKAITADRETVVIIPLDHSGASVHSPPPAFPCRVHHSH